MKTIKYQLRARAKQSGKLAWHYPRKKPVVMQEHKPPTRWARTMRFIERCLKMVEAKR